MQLRNFKENLLKYVYEVKSLYERGEEGEITYRTPFENFLTAIFPAEFKVIHESKDINIENGKKAIPDFIIKKNDFIIGYIETKSLENPQFNAIEKTDQIKKYLGLQENILATNYVNFKLINQEKEAPKIKEKVVLGKLEYINIAKKGSSYMTDIAEREIKHLESVFTCFLDVESKLIGNPKELASRLANISKILKEYLLEQIEEEKRLEKGQLYGMYISFRNNLSESLSKEEFVDSFAQVVSYSLFLAKLNVKGDTKLNLNNIKEHIETNFTLVAEMVKYLDIISNNIDLKWLIEELFLVVNNIDTLAIAERLAYNKQKDTNTKDPYIYFYEDFLYQYDKGTKQDRGVYYTPPEVVSYIVKSTNQILKEEFNLIEGFASENVKTLDFATGTGTFLLEIYNEVLEEIGKNSPRLKPIINERILKNIYGFEYLMAPYVVCHLKLSQKLKSFEFEMEEKQRLPVYLTNTLSELTPQYEAFLPALSSEGEEANKIKKQESLMVVIGNPPYNAKSKNPTKNYITNKEGKRVVKKIKDSTTGKMVEDLNYIGKLLEKYKPTDEKSIATLDDDYIKFLAFAIDKLKTQEKGIVSVIVNNSFINGLTHRKFRNELLKEFSSIYILNLNGDSRKKQTTKEGKADKNVFNIMQGVAIAIFVKQKAQKEYKVYYKSLLGERAYKLDYLNKNDYKSTKWQELDIKGFNQSFNNSLWSNQKVEASTLSKKQQSLIKDISSSDGKIKATQDSLLENEAIQESLSIKEEAKYITKKRFQDNLSFFTPIGLEGIIAYGNSIGINEIFNQYSSGIKTHNDKITIQFSKKEIEEVIKDLSTLDEDKIRKKYNLGQDSGDWQLQNAIDSLSKSYGNIIRVNYRPFDNRYTYYSKIRGFLVRHRYEILQHLLINNNMGFNFIRSKDGIREYNYFLATNKITDIGFLESSYNVPIYLTEVREKEIDKQVGKDKKVFEYIEERFITSDNFSSYFKEYIKDLYGLDISFKAEIKEINKSYFEASKEIQDNPNKENIDKVLGYIYGIMYSKPYKEKYLEYLKIDFPRIIFTEDKELFEKIAKVGQELMNLHLMKKVPKEEDICLSYVPSISKSIEEEEKNKVDKLLFNEKEGKLYINKYLYIKGVSKEVYEYKIAGEVLKNYLNRRKGRSLNLEELDQIENIAKVLKHTIELETTLTTLTIDNF